MVGQVMIMTIVGVPMPYCIQYRLELWFGIKSQLSVSFLTFAEPYNIVSSRLKVGPDMTRFERMEIIRRASWAANVSSLDVQQKEPHNFT